MDMLDIVIHAQSLAISDKKSGQELLDELQYNEFVLSQDSAYGMDPADILEAEEEAEEV